MGAERCYWTASDRQLSDQMEGTEILILVYHVIWCSAEDQCNNPMRIEIVGCPGNDGGVQEWWNG